MLYKATLSAGSQSGFRSMLRLPADLAAVTAPAFALLLPIMLALVGGAVDISRMFWIKNRLQGACDAGVLAGRKSISSNGYDTAAKAAALTYFSANFDQVSQGVEGAIFSSSANSSSNSVTGTASASVSMLFMRFFGWSNADLQVNCTSTMGVGNSDITMVLDVTGSMDTTLGSSTRIAALKSAMKNFYTTVSNAAVGSNARIRYGFVPYSSSVNVGQLLYAKNPEYLVDRWYIQSREPVFDETTTIKFSGWTNSVPAVFIDHSSSSYGAPYTYSNTAYNTQWECTSAMPATGSWTDSGPASIITSLVSNGSGGSFTKTAVAQRQRQTSYACTQSGGAYYIYAYDAARTYNSYNYNTSAVITSSTTQATFDHWVYRRIGLDVSRFKAFTPVSMNNGSNGTPVNYSWAGCIEERETFPGDNFSFSSGSGMSPSAALDLDIDTAPDAQAHTKWAPMWPQMAYYRTNGSSGISAAPVSVYGSSGGNYCPKKAQLLTAMTRTEFNYYADSLIANGATYLDIGMMWGARLSSPDGIFSDNVTAPANNGGPVGRHIIFMTDGQMDTANYVMQSYGIEFLDRRTTDDGSDFQSNAKHTERFRAICDATKSKGIRIWVIAFTSSLSSDLTYCASASSSFTAANATQLDAAFQTIAKQVGELRLQQ